MVNVIAELKRRNVLRASALYIGAVWALAQGIAQLAPVFDAPEWVTRWFVIAAAIGFPFFVAFAWFFEFTPDGLKRESEVAPGESIAAKTSKKLDRAIFAVMSLAIVLLLANTLVWRKGAGLQTADPSESQGSGLQAAAKGEPAAISIPDIATDPSIAVMPFVNLSSDKEQQYFSDGISEELLNLLSEVPGLRVIARTSSFSFRGKDASVTDIARKLQVAALLEGSVRKAGNQVRINVQLVRASDSTQLWSQDYDRTLTDIFQVQDDVAAQVVSRLKVTLLGAAPTVQAIDPRAYTLILQANALVNQPDLARLQRAVTLYQQALAIAPDAVSGWSGLGRTYINLTFLNAHPTKVGVRLARDALTKAVTLDPQDGLTFSRLGLVASALDNDQAAAAPLFQKALAMDPGSASVLSNAGLFLISLGRLQQAESLMAYAVARDPANPVGYGNLSDQQAYARQWTPSIVNARRALGLNPEYAGMHARIGVAMLLGMGDAAGALKEIQAEKDEFYRSTSIPLALDALGRKAEAEAALSALITTHGKDAAALIAAIYAQRGDAGRAFAWLDKAVHNQDSYLSLVHVDPLYIPLHADPRWLSLLRKVGTAPEHLAKIPFTVSLPDSPKPSTSNRP